MLAIASCAGTGGGFGSVAKTVHLAEGMKPAEVLKVLGEPSQVQQVGGHVVWKYSLHEYWKGYVPYYLVFDGTGKNLQSWYANEQEYQQQQSLWINALTPMMQQQQKQPADKASGLEGDRSDCAKKYRYREDINCYCYNIC
jgi:hypothetical protein